MRIILALKQAIPALRSILDTVDVRTRANIGYALTALGAILFILGSLSTDHSSVMLEIAALVTMLAAGLVSPTGTGTGAAPLVMLTLFVAAKALACGALPVPRSAEDVCLAATAITRECGDSRERLCRVAAAAAAACEVTH